MKTKIILYIIGIFLFCKINIAQEYPCGMPSPILRYNVPTNISGGYSDVEIMIYNQTQYFNREPSGPIRVLIIPVGAFFNGDLKYTPRSLSMFNHKLAGIEIIIPEQSSSSSPSFVSGNWDRTNGSENSQFSYGYGKYKFEFYRRVDDTIHGGYLWEFANYVYIDFRDTGPHFTPDSASEV